MAGIESKGKLVRICIYLQELVKKVLKYISRSASGAAKSGIKGLCYALLHILQYPLIL